MNIWSFFDAIISDHLLKNFLLLFYCLLMMNS